MNLFLFAGGQGGQGGGLMAYLPFILILAIMYFLMIRPQAKRQKEKQRMLEALKKDWKNIFRPGFSTKKIGWGLGLSLVKRIIHDIHAGQIKILSSNPDEGTVFEIRLNKAI